MQIHQRSFRQRKEYPLIALRKREQSEIGCQYFGQRYTALSMPRSCPAQILPLRKRFTDFLVPAVFKKSAFCDILAAEVHAFPGVQQAHSPAAAGAVFKPFAGTAFAVVCAHISYCRTYIIEICSR